MFRIPVCATGSGGLTVVLASFINAKAVEGTRSLSQSPDSRTGRVVRGGSAATSTSASSMYDGSVYTSGAGYSQDSRSGSSTFGAFDGEDSFVYFTHPVSSLVIFSDLVQLTKDAPFALFSCQ